jgi:apolipoprotein N-acyltransferase
VSKKKNKPRSKSSQIKEDGSDSQSKTEANTEPANPATSRRRDFKVLYIALASFAMLWVSFPPIGAGWLAWFALVPLLWLVQAPTLPKKSLRQIWFAAFLFFLCTFYFLTIPFWALWFGWALLAFYLSLYVPMFIVAARTLRHRFAVPVFIAAPIAWCGLEWVRGTFATGFGMAFLSHTQYKYPLTIQLADTFGAYGVSFVIVMFAAGLAVASMPKRLPRFWMDYDPGVFTDRDRNTTRYQVTPIIRVAHVVGSILVIASVVGYSFFRIGSAPKTTGPKLIVALIQSSLDTNLKRLSEAEYLDRAKKQFIHRRNLTLQARSQWSDLDLIVWPESSIAYEDLLTDYDSQYTVGVAQQNFSSIWQESTLDPTRQILDPIPLVAGTTTRDPENDFVYNSAVLIGDQGTITDRYFKIHRVMFGEYFPVLESIPYVNNLIRGFRALTPGTEFKNFTVKNTTFAPNICFESTVPHLIRRQLNTLDEQGTEPDVLINITNDGWFYGTSCLDLHLACNVFRAVEMRKTHLVCANTGFSAEIADTGGLMQVGKRRQTDLIRCHINPTALTSYYRTWGAWVPAIFGWLSLASIATALISSRLRTTK